jgi:hypothetical protein
MLIAEAMQAHALIRYGRVRHPRELDPGPARRAAPGAPRLYRPVRQAHRALGERLGAQCPRGARARRPGNGRGHGRLSVGHAAPGGHARHRLPRQTVAPRQDPPSPIESIRRWRSRRRRCWRWRKPYRWRS